MNGPERESLDIRRMSMTVKFDGTRENNLINKQQLLSKNKSSAPQMN